ncbi:glycosyltransferase family 4 protein [Agitococcus lubricus]|uniref:Glycosyltransferase involved in cell wall biosynthesis n=1 Tax=Agitococcus lubricus TaxID=1077255 RepID=A0A2T5J0G8_9GAMM|nr:glycosyltransferase family 4 protein [Agitococcus lubricus]PTQ89776.1 glycosyltransferase involved in cell wall biosynthesis [Agitococcus lubricus]
MIFFVGPLPPPVGGFSVITEKMYHIITQKTDVRLFNRSRTIKSRNRFIYALISFINLLRALAEFFLGYFKTKPSALYLALSGGNGQLVDLCFIVLCKLFKIPVFIHHHSFAYLDKPSKLTNFLFYMANAEHIVLCEAMKDKMIAGYNIDSAKIHVISNAVFLDVPSPVSKRNNNKKKVTLGYISNITEDKGIFEYFAAVKAAQMAGFDCDGIIAGPLHPSIQSRFQTELAQAKDIHYVGSVYGIDKQAFYQKIDILLFPTKYVNEAEPVIIHEAMSEGVPTVSVVRGCIASIIMNNTGCVAQQIEDYSQTVIQYLGEHTENTIFKRAEVERACIQHFVRLHEQSTATLSHVIHEMLA